MLENIEGAIKKGKSRQTGNIGYTRRRQTTQTHTTICSDTTLCKQTQTT